VRIGLDCQPLLLSKSGIGWYWFHILEQFLVSSPEYHYFLFAFSPKALKPDLPIGWNDRPLSQFNFAYRFPRTVALMISRLTCGRLPGDLYPVVDVCHFPNFTAFPMRQAKIVLTVHDLVFRLFPETTSTTVEFILNTFFASSLSIADRIVTDSRSTERDLLRFYPQVAGKTEVVYPGLDHTLFRPIKDQEQLERFRQKYGLRNYILSLGTLEPRKNLPNLLRAYQFLSQEMDLSELPDLVLVGAKGWKLENFSKEYVGLPKEVIRMLGYLPREELPPLYSAANLFAFPSLYEGFGLPVLEAMACGTPVVTSNVSSLPEVAGDAAILVNPTEPKEITQAMGDLLTDSYLAAQCSQRGILQASHFSWKQIGDRFLEIYKELAERAF
jgi:glycosyltransferase involved in cell wall biosynthesis